MRERLGRWSNPHCGRRKPAGPKCFGPRIASSRASCSPATPPSTTAPPRRTGSRTTPPQAASPKATSARCATPPSCWSAPPAHGSTTCPPINGWLDFEAAFISNFTGTYRRPGRPQQLEMCKQGPKTDRAYLTRWCEMRNSCEGVHEIQAISFFMGGCRPNTMLWHKLRRSGPVDGALMAVADNLRLNTEAARQHLSWQRRDSHGSVHEPARTAVRLRPCSRRGRQRGRRQPPTWKPRPHLRADLDSPCKYHGGKNPSNHTTPACPS
ncbi:hypothetical protein QYE76_063506 [Lolium multiflorum]|uniref:Retrotransposon gag domain-containing protein n=1 Tax=Lolium multiflorum TaxID=4521 RepID=A0AAD8S6A9_LOLMU|nr:hypothetical protein QYE76_063506 [Lolium multiflorum]